jgi:hypothetical protein
VNKRDGLGRQRWTVTHLNTGLFVVYVNAKDAETATRIADLIVNEVDWTGITKPDEFAEKDARVSDVHRSE